MEPFDGDELSGPELDALLPEWKAPPAPSVRLRAAVFPRVSRPWWRNLWSLSVRVPLPVAAALVAVAAFAAWRGAFTVAPPRVIVKTEVRTERLEVPAFHERVVTRTIYRDRIMRGAASAQQGPGAQELQPVAELRPVIIRSGE